jgi:hypothetical protein
MNVDPATVSLTHSLTHSLMGGHTNSLMHSLHMFCNLFDYPYPRSHSPTHSHSLTHSLTHFSYDMQIKPIPIQTTLLFVNNFVVNTTKFLNTFSEACDIKLTNISTKINNLDIVLSVLEAKLNSVPGLETDDIPPPSTTPSVSTDQSNATPEASQQASSSDMVRACEHPDYAPFFKLSK